jgi:7-cyano-7-deazaguanine reductase
MKVPDSPLTLLGASKTEYPKRPDQAVLETFPVDAPAPIVAFHTKEFTSLCERTQQPDFGSITVTYQPKDRAIESKSLKLFLFSYRNVALFYERIVQDILDRLVEAADPVWMEVEAQMNPRGGIEMTALLRYDSREEKPGNDL